VSCVPCCSKAGHPGPDCVRHSAKLRGTPFVETNQDTVLHHTANVLGMALCVGHLHKAKQDSGFKLFK
jgi:hypothetical protein